MEPSYDFAHRCWYKPDGQTQTVKMRRQHSSTPSISTTSYTSNGESRSIASGTMSSISPTTPASASESYFEPKISRAQQNLFEPPQSKPAKMKRPHTARSVIKTTTPIIAISRSPSVPITKTSKCLIIGNGDLGYSERAAARRWAPPPPPPPRQNSQSSTAPSVAASVSAVTKYRLKHGIPPSQTSDAAHSFESVEELLPKLHKTAPYKIYKGAYTSTPAPVVHPAIPPRVGPKLHKVEAQRSLCDEDGNEQDSMEEIDLLPYSEVEDYDASGALAVSSKTAAGQGGRFLKHNFKGVCVDELESRGSNGHTHPVSRRSWYRPRKSTSPGRLSYTEDEEEEGMLGRYAMRTKWQVMLCRLKRILSKL